MIPHSAAAYRVMGRRIAAPVDHWWLEALDDEARARSVLWSSATHWHWLDAAAWVASHRSRVMALLAGYRDFTGRGRFASVGEGAGRTVLQMHVREEAIAQAERALVAWCKAGTLEAVSIQTGVVLSQVEWIAGRAPIADGMPLVMIPADVLRELSPAPFVVDAPAAPDNDSPTVSADFSKEARNAECKRVAALFDAEGIPQRMASAELIAARWNVACGNPPARKEIWFYMAGGGKGGRPANKPSR